MYDNYNYPMGADTPDAPWNQREVPPINVKVGVNVNLRREAVVETTNYTDESDEGGYSIDLHDGFADLERLYTEQHHGIPKLLDELAKYIKGELAGGKLSPSRWAQLNDMLEDCKGWQEETEIDNYDL